MWDWSCTLRTPCLCCPGLQFLWYKLMTLEWTVHMTLPVQSGLFSQIQDIPSAKLSMCTSFTTHKSRFEMAIWFRSDSNWFYWVVHIVSWAPIKTKLHPVTIPTLETIKPFLALMTRVRNQDNIVPTSAPILAKDPIHDWSSILSSPDSPALNMK